MLRFVFMIKQTKIPFPSNDLDVTAFGFHDFAFSINQNLKSFKNNKFYQSLNNSNVWQVLLNKTHQT